MSQSTYTHSEMFARLKGTKETISTNLTSQQYLQSLDYLLYNALFYVVDNTKYVDIFLGKVIAWQSSNPKRKGSNVGKQALTNFIVLFLLTEDSQKKVKILRQMKLDRGILAEMLRKWLEITDPYELLCNKAELTTEDLITLRTIEAKACLRQGHSVYGASVQTRYWYEHSREFKSQIFQKYTRLVLKHAQRDYVDLGHRVSLDDIIQVYMMTANKAIDKCDTDQGVLTTHILHWLMSAKNIAATHTNGSTSFFPNAYKTDFEKQHTDNSMPVSIDSLENIPAINIDDTQEVEDQVERIRYIARIFDPQGYGRLTLGIQEYLHPRERYKLRSLIAEPIET